MSTDTRSLDALIQSYLDEQGLHTMEGKRGLSNFVHVIGKLGYSSLEDFLRDNSGAIEAMIDWIGFQRDPEWRNKFLALVKPEEHDDPKCMACNDTGIVGFPPSDFFACNACEERLDRE